MSRPTGPASLIAAGLLSSSELTYRTRRPRHTAPRRRRLRDLLRRG